MAHVSCWPTESAVASAEEEQLAHGVMTNSSSVVIWPAGGAVVYSWLHLQDKKTEDDSLPSTSFVLLNSYLRIALI